MPTSSNAIRRARLALLGALVLTPALVLTQGSPQFRERRVVVTAPGPWTGARLADGQPDVQGFWSNTIGNHNNLTNPQGRNTADDGPPREGPPRPPRAQAAPAGARAEPRQRPGRRAGAVPAVGAGQGGRSSPRT